jgi:hypothetical protein
MPRLALVAAAAFAIITAATPAHAIVPYVTLNGCPDDPGSTKDGTLACANGSTAVVVLTAQAGRDLNVIYFSESADFQLLSDTFGSAPYWDFEGGGTAECPLDPVSHVRNLSYSANKPGGCENYLGFFSNAAYINGHFRRNPSTVSLTFAKDGGPVPVQAGQQLFGFSIVFDMDHLDTCEGCSVPVRITATTAAMEDNGRIPQTDIGTGSDSVTLNTTVVPVQRQTWGRLKQLYR